MKDHDDIDLQRLLRGEKESWDNFVERFAPVIYAAVRDACAAHAGPINPDMLLDLAQDVYARLVKEDFKALKSYNPRKASLSTWLTVVARNVALDALRRKRLAFEPLEAAPEPAVEAILPREAGLPLPEGLLSPRQQLILQLRYEQDLTVEETARLLRIEAQTVRSTHHKALEKLRRHFGKGGDPRG